MASRPENTATDTTTSSKGSLLYDPLFRAIISQVLLVGFVIFIGYEIVVNTITNLQRQNIASGFGFLTTTAGFGINQTLIDYNEAMSYGRVFFVGLLNTVLVAFFGILLATILGFAVGIMRLSKNWVVSSVATIYVEITRNIPLLLQIFFWYFAVLRQLPNPRNSYSILDSVFLNSRGFYIPSTNYGAGSSLIFYALIAAFIAAFILSRWARNRQVKTGLQFPVFWSSLGFIIGLPLLAYFLAGQPISFIFPELKGFNFQGGTRVIPEFVSLWLALSIYTASYIAEVVRGGVLAVNHGQTEASHSLGLNNGQTLRLVVIPQAMRVIIPPLTNQYLNLTKNSSLAVAIAYPDIVSVYAGTVLNQTGQAIEVLSMTMAVYLTTSLLTSAFMNWFNSRYALVER